MNFMVTMIMILVTERLDPSKKRARAAKQCVVGYVIMGEIKGVCTV